MLQKILSEYAINQPSEILGFGSGLINGTWKITDRSGTYILQKINQEVFKEPGRIAQNIRLIAKYLEENSPGYLFPSPVTTISGEEMVYESQGYYRLFPFVAGSSTIDVVNNPQHAFEAAQQFARFTRLLAGFPVSSLQTTLPDFHNLILRYEQFERACQGGNPVRIVESSKEIQFILEHVDIVHRFKQIIHDPAFTQRVTHHDTKISNVLFDASGKGLCVIDLDTIMPGYFISDFGDMMRTYLSPVSEEESDFSKISIREEFFSATLHGYLLEMYKELSKEEINHMVYAGMFMIYMQAMRFLTDYLNDDRYYGARYEKHNLVRAGNQITLLQRMIDSQQRLDRIVQEKVTAIKSGK